MRADEIEGGVADLRALIKSPPPVRPYAAGTWGPPEADQLAVRTCDGTWSNPRPRKSDADSADNPGHHPDGSPSIRRGFAMRVSPVVGGQGRRFSSRCGASAGPHRYAPGACRERSAVCTHLVGDVHRNDAENTWDCPRHGSASTASAECSTDLRTETWAVRIAIAQPKPVIGLLTAR